LARPRAGNQPSDNQPDGRALPAGRLGWPAVDAAFLELARGLVADACPWEGPTATFSPERLQALHRASTLLLLRLLVLFAATARGFRPVAPNPRTSPVAPGAIDATHLGAIYEHLLGRRLRLTPDGQVDLESDRRGRKATGAFYTPDAIIEDVVTRAVGPALAEHLDRLRVAFREPRPPDLSDRLFTFRVLDPAMGSGQFLIEAVDFLTARLVAFLASVPDGFARAGLRLAGVAAVSPAPHPSPSSDQDDPTEIALLRHHVLARCIYGIDVDPLAVEIAKAGLWLHCAIPGLPLAGLPSHLIRGDFLVDAPPLRTFDCIVGNPPWISYSGRQAAYLPEPTARFYAAHYRSARGWRATQSLFLERAASLLRPGGRLGLVVPAQLSDLDGFQALRRCLAEHGEVEEPCPYHGEAAFAGVVQPAITVIFTRGPACPRQSNGWRIADSSPLPGERGQDGLRRGDRLPPLPAGEGGGEGESDSLASDGKCQHHLALGACPPHPNPLPREREGRSRPSLTHQTESKLSELFSHLAAMEPFGPGTFGDPGVHSGNAAAVLFSPDPAPGRAPIREGRDMQPFSLAEPRLFLNLEVPSEPGRYFRVGPAHRYAACPIVLRQTADRPIAALHQPPTYFRNSVLAGYGLPGVPDAALVAILNSELFAWFHRRRNRDARQRAFPQVKVSHLCAQPRPPTGGEAYALLSALEVEAREIARLSQSIGTTHAACLARVAGYLGVDPTRLVGLAGGRALVAPQLARPDDDHLPLSLADVQRFLDRNRTHLAGSAIEAATRSLEVDVEEYVRTATRLLHARVAAYTRANELVYRLYEVEPGQAAGIHRAVGAVREPPRSAWPVGAVSSK
jgi:N-6 DNA Methylase